MTPIRWFVLAVVFALGEAAAFAFPGAGFLWPHLLLLTFVAGSVAFALHFSRWPELVLLLFGAVIAAYTCENRTDYLFAAIDGPEHGRVESVVEVSGNAFVRTNSTGTVRISFFAREREHSLRLFVTAPAAAEVPRSGERMRVRGHLSRPRTGAFDETISLFACGKDDFVRRETDGSIRAFFIRLRSSLSRRMGIGLEDMPEIANLNRAILLGERGGISADSKRLFADAGTVHVFAISGLHVVIVGGVLWILLSMFLPYRALSAVIPPALWFYVCLVGAPPSAVRAALMVTHFCLAPVCWRRPDALVSWSFTLIVVCACNPALLFDVGAAFSFIVMLVIILWCRIVGDSVRGKTAAVSVSLIAWAAGVPIAAHVFGRIAPGAPIANLVLLPAASCGVTLALFGLLASFVSPWLAAHFNNFAALAIKAMIGVSEAVVRSPFGSFQVLEWNYVLCLEWYLALFLIMWYFHLRKNSRSSIV